MKNSLQETPYINASMKHNPFRTRLNILLVVSIVPLIVGFLGAVLIISADDNEGNQQAQSSAQIALTQSFIATEMALIPPTPTPIPQYFIQDEVQHWPPTNFTPLGDTSGKIEGQLQENEQSLLDGTLYDIYKFAGVAGQTINISAASSTFDPFVMLVEPGGNIIAYNDDANSKVSTSATLDKVILPNTQEYYLIVNSVNAPNQPNEYSLAWNFEGFQQTFNLAVNSLTTGMIGANDVLDDEGNYTDYWSATLPQEPVVISVVSNTFDPLLRVLDSSGKQIVANDNRNFVAGDLNPRVVVLPGTHQGSVQVAVSTEAHPIGGEYSIEVYPLTTEMAYREATLRINPIIVAPHNTTQTPPESQAVQAILEHTSQMWNQCGISVTAPPQIPTLTIPGLNDSVVVYGRGDWTPDETILQRYNHRNPIKERHITVYIVNNVDGGETVAASYPTTRYAGGASGYIILSYAAITNPEYINTLAHEIGHILGLEHADAYFDLDGDPWNDTNQNLMYFPGYPGPEIDRYQCAIALGETHYLTFADTTHAAVAQDLKRSDRVLMPGESITGALTTNDSKTDSGQYLDVYYVNGSKGEEITLELVSPDFDTYLFVQNSEDVVIAVNDDFERNSNSSVTFTVQADGDYFIGVSSYQYAVGAYTLSVKRPTDQHNIFG